MTDAELEAALKSIGKAAFVSHYDLLADIRRPREKRIDDLMARTGYARGGAARRVASAQAIFGAGRAGDAIATIANSTKTDPRAIAAARAWLADRA